MLAEKLALREWPLIAVRYEMPSVRTIEEIRHARLLQLLEDKQRFPTIQSLADTIERSHAQVSQWKNQSKRAGGGVSNIDSASARWIEQRTGKPLGWMDNDPAHDHRPTVRPPRGDKPLPPDFDALDVTPSEWALLEDLRVMPEEELKDLRDRAARNRANVDRIIAQRQAAAQGDKAAHGAGPVAKRRAK